jgi:hypothetical protein
MTSTELAPASLAAMAAVATVPEPTTNTSTSLSHLMLAAELDSALGEQDDRVVAASAPMLIMADFFKNVRRDTSLGSFSGVLIVLSLSFHCNGDLGKKRDCRQAAFSCTLALHTFGMETISV